LFVIPHRDANPDFLEVGDKFQITAWLGSKYISWVGQTLRVSRRVEETIFFIPQSNTLEVPVGFIPGYDFSFKIILKNTPKFENYYKFLSTLLNENNPLQVGDRFTITEWINRQDRSWIGQKLVVTKIEAGFVWFDNINDAHRYPVTISYRPGIDFNFTRLVL
jgi:hypothetical protein